uniref:Uncharacterized protein n=1 Tax=Hyaloperonospora arabidopsidis (strain Emoy2) TaxID=559515 RepID=M4C0B7_HYAAE
MRPSSLATDSEGITNHPRGRPFETASEKSSPGRCLTAESCNTTELNQSVVMYL